MRTIICNKSIQSRLSWWNCALFQDSYLYVAQIKRVIGMKLCKWKSDPDSRPLQTSSGDLSLLNLTLTPSLRDHHMRSSNLPQAQHVFFNINGLTKPFLMCRWMCNENVQSSSQTNSKNWKTVYSSRQRFNCRRSTTKGIPFSRGP